MSEAEKPMQAAMGLALDLWKRRMVRVVEAEARRALDGLEPNHLSVMAPTQADAAFIAEIFQRIASEARDEALSEAWSVAEHFTQYGVLPQRSKERKVADSITDGIEALKADKPEAQR